MALGTSQPLEGPGSVSVFAALPGTVSLEADCRACQNTDSPTELHCHKGGKSPEDYRPRAYYDLRSLGVQSFRSPAATRYADSN